MTIASNMLKKEIRNQILHAKRSQTASQLLAWSAVITEKLKNLPEVKAAHTIFCYYSLQDEVNTHTLVEELREAGKKILLPKVTGDGIMELRQYDGKESMCIGAYGIMEPTGKLFTNYEEIDVALIPGVAFDKNGNRLGRGKGFYDRILPFLKNAHKIGVCFPFQYIASVPAEKHDIPVDQVIR